MTIRVLVVDDSRFFRRRVTEMLEADPRISVIGAAENGAEAVKMAGRLRPDIITMDVEMPLMDGITATRHIMQARPTTILMFSSLTTDGAQSTLDALEAGAVDFLPKRFEDISRDRKEATRLLCERVIAVARRGMHAAPSLRSAPITAPVSRPAAPRPHTVGPAAGQIELVAIGTSTGGPVALQDVLSKLPADFPLPLLLIQHMPGSFTTAFAERLDRICNIRVHEAADGDPLTPGTALLAPGSMQTTLEKRGGHLAVRVSEPSPGQNYKPCVDVTFSSIAQTLPGKALAVVLTGMGADGREGARRLKQSGATVWAQDEASSVIYGMPAAIVEAGLADQILPLEEVGPALLRVR